VKIYIAGAWVEQHQRARPMLARVREAGLTVSCDWTQAEGDVCACGHHRQEHAPFADCGEGWRAEGTTRCEKQLPTGHVGDVERCTCASFNGIGSGGDSLLTDADRRKYAQADLDGVLAADIVWLLAANDRGACGSWVELGAALAAKTRFAMVPSSAKPPHIVVSGPKCKRTIFTELADVLFETDEAALAYVIEQHRRSNP
jgi:hypothetical protein